MAWAAFILSFFGCLCVPAIISFILGLVVLIKDKGGKGLAIAALVLSFLSPLLAGIPAAIAIPNFITFQTRAKQTECKTNLKALYVAQRAYFQENDRYTEDMEELGFVPVPLRRYSYFVSRTAQPIVAQENPVMSLDELPDLDDVNVALGVVGECPACEFTAVCAGNLDKDDALDIWMMSTAGGMDGPAGQPYQLSNDATN